MKVTKNMRTTEKQLMREDTGNQGWLRMSEKIRFRLPESIKIKGKKYKLKHVKNLKDDDGKPCMGLHDHENKVISIDKLVIGSEKRQTLLHEFFHAYLYECNIREGLDSQLEEVIVEALSQGIEEHFDIKWKK